ncbi:hypothetical protein AVEN_204402-1 [Araneus ventricosus]|uniref:Uncharacterized protein n=1 Tax=Araneus ventricosus TaxID=182803 RepID=A0A4Y2QSI2_ARAVE|nr:hypothetical protein AVEN_204402-1 [Araneus ventricosus]
MELRRDGFKDPLFYKAEIVLTRSSPPAFFGRRPVVDRLNFCLINEGSKAEFLPQVHSPLEIIKQPFRDSANSGKISLRSGLSANALKSPYGNTARLDLQTNLTSPECSLSLTPLKPKKSRSFRLGSHQ